MDLFILLNAHLHFTMRHLVKKSPEQNKKGACSQNWGPPDAPNPTKENTCKNDRIVV